MHIPGRGYAQSANHCYCLPLPSFRFSLGKTDCLPNVRFLQVLLTTLEVLFRSTDSHKLRFNSYLFYI